MTTWTLTAAGPSAAALNLAAAQAGIPGVLPFGEDGTQDQGIWYDDGISDFTVSITGDQPGNPDFAPVWMYRVREYLEQSGYRATVTAADADPAFRGTGNERWVCAAAGGHEGVRGRRNGRRPARRR